MTAPDYQASPQHEWETDEEYGNRMRDYLDQHDVHAEKYMTSGDLYLIAHKVRGEPGFDIAVKMPMADGDWWIIPTSGHRAYPFWYGLLDERFYFGPDPLPPMPPDLPDHYPATPTRSVSPLARAGDHQQRTIPSLEDI